MKIPPQVVFPGRSQDEDASESLMVVSGVVLSLATAKEFSITMIEYSSLGKGFLTGQIEPGRYPPPFRSFRRRGQEPVL